MKTSVHTSLVAPLDVGDRAYTGAGSTITEDVPEGALAIARERQKNIEGYADREEQRTRRNEQAPRATDEEAPVGVKSVTASYEKRLMLTAGRASLELGGKIAEKLDVEPIDAGLKTFP